MAVVFFVLILSYLISLAYAFNKGLFAKGSRWTWEK